MTHTTAIIIITLVVTVLAWQSPSILRRLMFYPPAIKRGEIDRFITHGFIHANFFICCLI